MTTSTSKFLVRSASLRLADGGTQANADLATTTDATFVTFPAVTQLNTSTSFVYAAPPLAAGGGLKVRTLVTFANAEGAYPYAGLIADAAGDLFGTTALASTVFEIVKTANGYASTPTTLVSFNNTDGESPYGGLIADPAGDLLGTTAYGGASNDGTVFEIVKTADGYSSTPNTLVNFTGVNGEYPIGSLIADAAGDLFGTTEKAGPNGYGTVFEIVKTADGYGSTPTTLVSFNGANGANPDGSLLADAAGDLFGTTSEGGANNDGTVFEIVKTDGGYASTPTTLVSFNGADGANPIRSLIADAAGDLFGTTAYGGANNYGTVFEIVKTADGYGSTPTTLVSFDGADGAGPRGSLIADAAGDLFGTTTFGGTRNQGTVFEIIKTTGGYASTPTSLVSFGGKHGENPDNDLLADTAGDLFGTTANGGPDDEGLVFEIRHSGFMKQSYPKIAPTAAVAPGGDDNKHSASPSAVFVQAMAAHRLPSFGSGVAEVFASRNEMATLLCRPKLA